jgi:hypothetical protein
MSGPRSAPGPNGAKHKAGADEKNCSAKAREPNDPASTTPVSFEDFVAYMPDHKYIFRPTRQLWVGASVNARLPAIPARIRR